MEVWNGIWKKILVWNGYGIEENCQYEIRKNHLPFHTMPCFLGLRWKIFRTLSIALVESDGAIFFRENEHPSSLSFACHFCMVRSFGGCFENLVQNLH